MRKLVRLIKKYRNFYRYKRYQRLKRKVQKLQQKVRTGNAKMLRIKDDVTYVNKIHRYYKAKLSRLGLRTLYVNKVQNNRVMFMSYQGGQYTCNPRKICEYLMEQYPGKFEIIWAFQHPEQFKELEKLGIKLVKYNSKEYLKMALTSKCFIYNMRIPEAIPFRKNQVVISTGHGGGAYKKLLLDTPGITNKERKMIQLCTDNTDIFISTCKAYTESVCRGAYGFSGEVLECGMPRNDDLVNNHLEEGEEVRDYYDIPKDTKILLYAPTYRKGPRVAMDYGLDAVRIREACEKRFGGKWVVIYRLHHFIKNSFPTNLSKLGVIDATHYYDMQRLIKAADVLITDYSSSVWDFSLMKKPCFLYATDIDTYTTQQGFYTSVFEWPFPIGQDNDELEAKILNFDEASYVADVEKHHERLQICETGHATEIIGDRVYKECFNN